MQTAIWWIRRDLRLTDNQALNAAIKSSREIVPLFIIDPQLWDSEYAGENRLSFLSEGLRALDISLKQRGSRLFVSRGKPEVVLSAVLGAVGAEEVFAEEDYSPYARRRDESINRQLALNLLPGLTVHHPEQVFKSDGDPYTIYTPYMRAWKKLRPPGLADVIPAPEYIHTNTATDSINTIQIPHLDTNSKFKSGEEIAQQKLQAFVDGDEPKIYHYALLRDYPDVDGTSGLSPYLRFGMLSARQAVVTALAAIQETSDAGAQQNAAVWLNELIWREFYQSILYHFPNVLHESFQEDYRKLEWSNDIQDFAAWKQGETGFPLVDAGMRQLKKEGWLHNRVRMVVASFLTKNLLIDWRWGQRWFMKQLVDGDPASNNGGWQWTAGTGNDAAPYFRIFNPSTQSKKFDPDGAYIRRWVPELRQVPVDFIHEPWRMPPLIQRKTGCVIGVEYPEPIIDIAWSRQRALSTFRLAKARAGERQLIE